jgi:NAD-dependent DNA ligase
MERNRELLFKFIDCVKFKDSKSDPAVVDKPVIVFTGSMPKPRDYYKKLAEDHGYLFKDAITKATSVLVIAEAGHKSTKVAKAEKNGCKIITLKEFMKEVGEDE